MRMKKDRKTNEGYLSMRSASRKAQLWVFNLLECTWGLLRPYSYSYDDNRYIDIVAC